MYFLVAVAAQYETGSFKVFNRPLQRPRLIVHHLRRLDVLGTRVDVVKLQTHMIFFAAMQALFRLLIFHELPRQFFAASSHLVLMGRGVFQIPTAVVLALLLFVPDWHRKIAGPKTPLFYADFSTFWY